jgi:hypothetical protein
MKKEATQDAVQALYIEKGNTTYFSPFRIKFPKKLNYSS